MSANSYDFWLLDLDGTLVDVEHWYIRRVMDIVGDRMGVSFTDREMEVLWYGFGDAREQFFQENGIDANQFWNHFHHAEDPISRAEATYLFDDAKRIGSLRAPVGVVTHCQRYLTEPVLEHLDITDWFDTVVCCTDETGWKPDPAPVYKAMRNLGVAHNGHEGVLAGDDPVDVSAAVNAGLDSIHVARSESAAASNSLQSDFCVTTLDELSRISCTWGVDSK